MRLLWPQMSLELKGLRLFAVQIFISLAVIPGSYLFVILVASDVNEGLLCYELCGFTVASLIGSLLSLLALQVSNFMQPTVLELYAALPVRTEAIVMAKSVVYVVLVLPQTFVAMALSVWYAQAVAAGALVAGIFSTLVMLTLIGISLGIAIRNPFIAQGVLPLLAWVLLVLSPVYYPSEGLHPVLHALAVANPITHALNVIRVPLGMPALIPVGASYVYIGVLSSLMAVYATIKLRKMYILERFF